MVRYISVGGGHPFRPFEKMILIIIIICLIYTYYIKYNIITYYIIIISNYGRGPYSIHFMNQAGGCSKFDQGLHLAHGSDFGHA